MNRSRKVGPDSPWNQLFGAPCDHFGHGLAFLLQDCQFAQLNEAIDA
jgi:hypothetical protein